MILDEPDEFVSRHRAFVAEDFFAVAVEGDEGRKDLDLVAGNGGGLLITIDADRDPLGECAGHVLPGEDLSLHDLAGGTPDGSKLQ